MLKNDANGSLQLKEETLSAIIEASPSAMLMVNDEGNIVLVNYQVELLTGYQREEMLGQKVELLLPDRFRQSHLNLRESFLRKPQKRAMGEERDLYCQRKDGKEVPVEIGLNPISIEGRHYVIASILDISERKRAEETFRMAVEASPSAMIIVNTEGEIVLVNKQVEQVFGYSRNELIKKRVEVLVPEHVRSDHPQKMEAYMKSPAVRAMGAGRDLYGLHKDGHEIPIEIGLNPIQTKAGRFILASIIDITQRLQAENEKKIEVLLEEVHHRIKNNLAIISSIMQMESRRLNKDDEKVKNILNSAINRIASIAKLHESLYNDKKFDQIEISNYLKRLSQDILMSTSNESNTTVLFRFSDENCFLSIEQSVPIGLIFNEFVTNSIKHSSVEGNLTISTSISKTPTSLVLSLSDNGTGMDLALLKSSNKTLGLKIIDMLSRQIEANVNWENVDGTKLELKISTSKRA
jgi:PAS domain S-box-containing protein